MRTIVISFFISVTAFALQSAASRTTGRASGRAAGRTARRAAGRTARRARCAAGRTGRASADRGADGARPDGLRRFEVHERLPVVEEGPKLVVLCGCEIALRLHHLT